MKTENPLPPHLLYKSPLGLMPVFLTDIIHLEAYNKQTKVYTINSEAPIIFPDSINSYAKLLTPNFFCTHRSHIANLHYLVNYNNKERTLLLQQGHKVPVSEHVTPLLIKILTPKKIKKNYRFRKLFFRFHTLFFRFGSIFPVCSILIV